MKKANRIRSIITILTVLALLLTLMPMAVMAKGQDKKSPKAAQQKKGPADKGSKRDPIVTLDETGDEAETPDDTELPDEGDLEDPEGPDTQKVKKNPKAQFVAERNAWAKENGMPPGYANIMYKYLVSSSQLAPVTKDAASVGTAMDGIKAYLASFTPDTNPEFFNDNGDLDIRAIMASIKQMRMVADETDVELPEDDADEDADEDAGEDDGEDAGEGEDAGDDGAGDEDVGGEETPDEGEDAPSDDEGEPVPEPAAETAA